MRSAYMQVKKYESSQSRSPSRSRSRNLSRSKSPRNDLSKSPRRSISKSRSPSPDRKERDSGRKGFDASSMKTPEKPKLSREQRENLRHVKRKKDFICLERVKGKIVNVLDGLELHTGVFSAVEQKWIVNQVYQLQKKGRKGELKEHTFNAPRKWMRGKGRVTIQFGCCYNYAIDRAGNPPGILQREEVDPFPPLFKEIIRRLIKWHVLPPACVPDSCIVNIYDKTLQQICTFLAHDKCYYM